MLWTPTAARIPIAPAPTTAYAHVRPDLPGMAPVQCHGSWLDEACITHIETRGESYHCTAGSDEVLAHSPRLKHSQGGGTACLTQVVVAELTLPTGLTAEKGLDRHWRAVLERSCELMSCDLPASVLEVHEIGRADSRGRHADQLTLSLGIVRLDHLDARGSVSYCSHRSSAALFRARVGHPRIERIGVGEDSAMGRGSLIPAMDAVDLESTERRPQTPGLLSAPGRRSSSSAASTTTSAWSFNFADHFSST